MSVSRVALGIVMLSFGIVTIVSTIAGAYALSQVTLQNEAQWDGTVTIDFVRFDLRGNNGARVIEGGFVLGLFATSVGGFVLRARRG